MSDIIFFLFFARTIFSVFFKNLQTVQFKFIYRFYLSNVHVSCVSVVSRNCRKMAAERGRAPVMTARATAEWRSPSWKSEYNRVLKVFTVSLSLPAVFPLLYLSRASNRASKFPEISMYSLEMVSYLLDARTCAANATPINCWSVNNLGREWCLLITKQLWRRNPNMGENVAIAAKSVDSSA